jgi:hypothetical protein
MSGSDIYWRAALLRAESLWRLERSDELVSAPADGGNEARVFRVVVEGLAEFVDGGV